jgi:hypothetical protein
MCAHNNEPCECTDAEMQPCLAALIESYLEEMRCYVLSGERDFLVSGCCLRREMDDICRSFPTWDALRFWIEGPDTP